MNNSNQKLKIVVVIIVITFIATIGLYFLSTQKKPSIPLAIVSSIPADNTQGASVFEPITVTFNQTVDPNSVSIISDPSETWTTSQSNDTTLVFNHSLYLRVATKYKITIAQKTNVIGKINFETAHEQNDPRYLQTLQSQLDKDYPLASLTPYVTPNYKVIYSAPLTLEIQITGNISSQDAVSEVKSWVSSNNVDPNTHKYVVASSASKP